MTEEVSIGDYVLSGGELPAAVIVEAVGRLVPGGRGGRGIRAGRLIRARPARLSPLHLGRLCSTIARSQTCCCRGTTRRSGAGGSGETVRRTMERRPKLLLQADLDDEEREILAQLRDVETRRKAEA